jgi:hypothetical protein
MIYGHRTSTSRLCLRERTPFEKRALYDVNLTISPEVIKPSSVIQDREVNGAAALKRIAKTV